MAVSTTRGLNSFAFLIRLASAPTSNSPRIRHTLYFYVLRCAELLHRPQIDDKSYLSVSTYASAAHAGSGVYGQKSSWNAHHAKPKFSQPNSLLALPELSVSETSQMSTGGAGMAPLGGGLKQLSSVNSLAAAAAGGSSFARRHYRRKKDGASAAVGGGLTNLPMPSGAMKKL